MRGGKLAAPSRPLDWSDAETEVSASRLVPLVVDLDRTLCRTDTLHESLFALLTQRPLAIGCLPIWLSAGKAGFKRAIADLSLLDPQLLPYDKGVLGVISQVRDAGRPVALVSASDHRQVEAVAAHLGLFELAIGTGSDKALGNLRGETKADFLVERYGAQGFDYMGDSVCDIPVWQASRRSYGVHLDSNTRAAAAACGLDLTEVGPRDAFPARPLMRACRPHQWAKNLLILVPMFTAQAFEMLPVALLAMLCFSLAASAIYIVNDLVDLPSDRLHPRKCLRPFAAGEVSVWQGLTLSGFLLILSMGAAAFLLPPAFGIALLVYLVATSAYSFWLKRKMMVDVIALATLYTLRIVAGGVATGIALSHWLLVFSMFFFFALAMIKRQAELEDMAFRGVETTAGRNLILADLPVLQSMSVGASVAAVLVFALYSQDPNVDSHFMLPNLLLLICPVLFLWLGRMQLLTRRGYMTDDPIVFAFRDRVSLILGILMLAIFVAAAHGGHLWNGTL